MLTIRISHDLQPCTTYYSNVSLVILDGNISTRVLHSFRIVHTTNQLVIGIAVCIHPLITAIALHLVSKPLL